jgi:hypothetical protein
LVWLIFPCLFFFLFIPWWAAILCVVGPSLIYILLRYETYSRISKQKQEREHLCLCLCLCFVKRKRRRGRERGICTARFQLNTFILF